MSDGKKPLTQERVTPRDHLECNDKASFEPLGPKQVLAVAFVRFVPNPDFFLEQIAAGEVDVTTPETRIGEALLSDAEPSWAEVIDLVAAVGSHDAALLAEMSALARSTRSAQEGAQLRKEQAKAWRDRVDEYVEHLRETEAEIFRSKGRVIARVQNWAASPEVALGVADRTIANHLYETLS